MSTIFNHGSFEAHGDAGQVVRIHDPLARRIIDAGGFTGSRASSCGPGPHRGLLSGRVAAHVAGTLTRAAQYFAPLAGLRNKKLAFVAHTIA